MNPTCEQNPPGFNVTAKILVVAVDRAAMIKQLEKYIERLRFDQDGNANYAYGLAHLRASYSDDPGEPLAWVAADLRGRHRPRARRPRMTARRAHADER